MTEPITPELFQHLVLLAALELGGEEAEYIRQQLNNQLKAINELAAIPLDESAPGAVPPTMHGVPYTPEITPPIRSDEWQPYPRTEAILSQAPQLADGYIVVPEIPHTDI